MSDADLDCRYKLVLLVDDSDLDNFINEKIMRASRFANEVKIINSVKDALEFIGQLVQQPGADMPSFIFIDLNMPVMSGYEFIQHLKPTLEGPLRGTRLVILTSSLHEQDRVNVRNISTDILFLNKPLRAEMLHSIEVLTEPPAL
jgi:CheY-like chemotaxis protein